MTATKKQIAQSIYDALPADHFDTDTHFVRSVQGVFLTGDATRASIKREEAFRDSTGQTYDVAPREVAGPDGFVGFCVVHITPKPAVEAHDCSVSGKSVEHIVGQRFACADCGYDTRVDVAAHRDIVPTEVNGITIVKVGEFLPGSLGSYAGFKVLGHRPDAEPRFGQFSLHTLAHDDEAGRWFLLSGTYDLQWDRALAIFNGRQSV